ncbi:MAG TPA: multidrug efflux SMR transporter [Syntrophales bacterium]|jgi:small multidrug resistance pump|nr:multidrug efflux SMR transporter [Syntrophales bacterium]HPX56783.1 multidrug efflux SMR transporter [Syntrophales bacterium]HQA83126.1 multidrug efflux SMR transporter [Syntrophales bacterium]
MREWCFLLAAIICEVVATALLKSTEGFSRFWPSAIVVVGYALSFFFLSLTLEKIPVGIAYAIWSGVGTTLIVLIAWLFMGQKLDIPALAGILLIVSGVVILNMFSESIVR